MKLGSSALIIINKPFLTVTAVVRPFGSGILWATIIIELVYAHSKWIIVIGFGYHLLWCKHLSLKTAVRTLDLLLVVHI
jgi:hypothetical protein